MKALFILFERLWTRLAFKIARISFPSIVICIAILICLYPQLFLKQSFVENSIVYISAKFNGIRERQAEVALVSVPDAKAMLWQKDIYQADQLSLLLANILHSSDARIGLLLDKPLAYEARSVDSLVTQAQIDLGPIGQAVRQKLSLSEMLTDPRVVLGFKNGTGHAAAKFQLTPQNSFEMYFEQLNSWPSNFEKKNFTAFSNDAKESAYPLVNSLSSVIHFWQIENKDLYPTYLAALCSGFDKNNRTLELIGFFQATIKQIDCFESALTPVQPFVAAYDRLEGFRTRTIQLNMDEALALSTFPSLVLIASESDQILNQRIAEIMQSVRYGHVLIVPPWADLLQRSVFFVFACFILIVATKIKSRKWKLGLLSSAYVGLYVASLMLAILCGFLISLSVIFVAAACIAMFSSLRNIVWRDLVYRRQQLAESIVNSVGLLESERAFEEAVTLLEHHPDSNFASQKISEICDSLAREPAHLAKAIALLESIHPRLRYQGVLNEKLNSFRSDLSRTRTLQTAERKKPIDDGTELPEKLGRYQIEKELGRGAVGVVYLGFDPAIARKVAIKTLDTRLFNKEQVDELKQRFYREAEAVGRLNHPNIVSVYDLGEEQDLAYIAMDYVEGVPLSEHVLEESLLPIAEVYRIVHDVANALAYAHEKQIVHRDIKPSNIMYGASEHVIKVADFGIARLLDNSRTTTGEILGSPLYMAPEQLKGSKVGVTADIFSLGVTFYQLLSAELPFDGENLAALTYEIIHTKHKNIRLIRKDLPASAARIVNQCLQKAPKNRYQSAQELVAVMRKAIKRDFPDIARSMSVV